MYVKLKHLNKHIYDVSRTVELSPPNKISFNFCSASGSSCNLVFSLFFVRQMAFISLLNDGSANRI